MDWQQATALAIVIATAAIMLWFRFRPCRLRRGRSACAGCGSDSSAGPRESVVFHARKGRRPEIFVRPASGRDAAP